MPSRAPAYHQFEGVNLARSDRSAMLAGLVAAALAAAAALVAL
ncbi:hypothetical protein [Streptomyces sp. NPDC046759]